MGIGNRIPSSKIDFEKDELHAALYGVDLPVDEWAVSDGLLLKKTFAHLIAPYVLAFAPPPHPRAPHPGPWMSLAGGGLDMTAELTLAADVRPTGFDRVNTLWFVLALLRMRTGQDMQLPFIADRPIDQLAANTTNSQVTPVELQMFRLRQGSPRPMSIAELEWLTRHFSAAAEMMDDPVFNRAFQTFDSIVWAHSAGAGIVVAWACIETLVRPGQRQITDRLAKSVAVLLEPAGPARSRLFARVREGYEARGGSVHDSRAPDADQLAFACKLAREVITRVIEARTMPDIDALLSDWQAGH